MYKEDIGSLSCTCPPPESIILTNVLVAYRLVSSHPANEDDFKSHAALGKYRPKDIDECRWSSCSLFLEPGLLIDIKGLPKVKNKKAIVKISLSPTTGPILKGQKGHIDWWPLHSCDISAISCLERVL